VSYNMYDWGGGASVDITVKNNSTAAINGWALDWSFAGNQKINNIWCASYTQNGTKITAKNMSYNSTLPAGGSVSFGFTLTYSGPNAKPSGFTLNGTNCAIGN
jgi:cellulase/cellobiase CelA1